MRQEVVLALLAKEPSHGYELRARLRDALDIELSFASILSNPTVSGLARQVFLQASSADLR